jgi:hypothetical protein
MKRWLGLLLFVCVIAAGLLCLLPSSSRLKALGSESAATHDPASTTSSPAEAITSPVSENTAAPQQPPEQSGTSSPPAVNRAPDLAAASGSSDTASAGGEPAIATETVLENVRTTIRLYGSMFGGNPVGTNPEITSALNGANPKHVKFLRADAGLQVNQKGELVDIWGTPYFFHQLSRTEMEIRSAGPDKVMWTADDLVIK